MHPLTTHSVQTIPTLASAKALSLELEAIDENLASGGSPQAVQGAGRGGLADDAQEEIDGPLVQDLRNAFGKVADNIPVHEKASQEQVGCPKQIPKTFEGLILL